MSYFILVFFPENYMLTYIANVLMITSIGGANNINLLIIEMRVPPSNVAAVSLMIRTMSVSSGVLASTVASLPAPFPFIVLFAIATAGLLASMRLPPPGEHLPSVEVTGDNKFKLVDKETSSPTSIHP